MPPQITEDYSEHLYETLFPEDGNEEPLTYERTINELEENLNSGEDALIEEILFELFEFLFEEQAYEDYFHYLALYKIKQPQFYQDHALYLFHDAIEAKFSLNCIDDACAYFVEFCELSHADLDTFYPTMYLMLYHNQLPTLIKGMKIVWDLIDDTDLFEWAIEEFQTHYTEIIFFNEFIKVKDNPLWDTLEKTCLSYDNNGLLHKAYLNIILSELKQAQTIQPQDVIIRRNELKDKTLLHSNLVKVRSLFIHYAMHQSSISINPCQLYFQWHHIVNYLYERTSGNLNLPIKKIKNVLVAEHTTLDAYIMKNFTGMFGMNLNIYQSILFLKTISQWYQFIITNKWADNLEELTSIRKSYKPIKNIIINEKPKNDKLVHDIDLNINQIEQLINKINVVV